MMSKTVFYTILVVLTLHQSVNGLNFFPQPPKNPLTGLIDDAEKLAANVGNGVGEVAKNLGNGVGEVAKDLGNGVGGVISTAVNTTVKVTYHAGKRVYSGVVMVGKEVINVADYASSIGGKLIDLIETTYKEIPIILTSGLWVYDGQNVKRRLTLEIPSIIEFSGDMRENVIFTLFTRRVQRGQLLSLSDVVDLRKSDFDYRRETIIVTHGWLNDGRSPICRDVTNAVLQSGDYNVIVVDWGKVAQSTNYVFAANSVTGVGKHVAQMIDFLVSQGMQPDKTRIVGHSLGAHVAGLAGYYARSKVLYVTGLDPALPLFFSATPTARISTESARHVEIIHTNSGLLGVVNPLGHADFYPNGGKEQKGCPLTDIISCSHSRAYEYFVESIVNRKKEFIGRQCPSHFAKLFHACNGPVAVMGTLRGGLTLRGAFSVETNSDRPFACQC